MPITHHEITTERKLQRALKGISNHFLELQHEELTEEKLNKFESYLVSETNNITQYVHQVKHKDTDNILEKLTGYQASLAKIRASKQNKEAPFEVKAWIEKRTAELQAEEDKWEKHRQERPQRAAERQKERETAAQEPIQSRHQLKKAIGEQKEVANTINNPEASDEQRKAAKKQFDQNRDNIHRFLSKPENRANPKDQKMNKKMRDRDLGIDNEINKLSDALYELQHQVPKLSSMAKHMAAAIAEFQLSIRDDKAFSKLDMACGMLFNQDASYIKDPMMQRLWHSVITTVKAFLKLLDCVQSKITGKEIDQPGREHLFKTPSLPVHEAKEKFKKALDHMSEEMEKIMDTKHKPQK